MSPVPAISFLLLIGLSDFVVIVAGVEEGFLKGTHRRAYHEDNFRAAMGAVMGCGGGGASKQVEVVETSLAPIWKVLPRNQYDLVDWSMVRYIAHRYFVQRSNFLVRGFEPMKHVDMSDMGAANLLNQHGLFDGHRSSNGFSFADTVAIVATLEQIIDDADHILLHRVFDELKFSVTSELDRYQMENVARYYVMRWLLGDQIAGKEAQGMAIIERSFHGWQGVKDFIDGEIHGLVYVQSRSPRKGDALRLHRFSFEEIFQVVSSITKSFASYWESECHHIHDSLVAMDKTGTGRVSLSDFYAAKAKGEWRFAESENYLRELGALDETSFMGGKQIMIANYVQGANNCIVSTDQYLVCCAQQCEEVMNSIEDHVGSPLATPAEVLASIANASDFNDEVPRVSSRLSNQLAKLAENYGGRVPLHGRLFAQWLHYLLPRQCPFPHKKGAISSVTPSQFGANFQVSAEELKAHAGAATAREEEMQAQQAEAQAMSQWSEEEELLVDYSSYTGESWGVQKFVLYACAMVFLFMAAGAAVGEKKGRSASGTISHAYQSKEHFV